MIKLQKMMAKPDLNDQIDSISEWIQEIESRLFMEGLTNVSAFILYFKIHIKEVKAYEAFKDCVDDGIELEYADGKFKLSDDMDFSNTTFEEGINSLFFGHFVDGLYDLEILYHSDNSLLFTLEGK